MIKIKKKKEKEFKGKSFNQKIKFVTRIFQLPLLVGIIFAILLSTGYLSTRVSFTKSMKPTINPGNIIILVAFDGKEELVEGEIVAIKTIIDGKYVTVIHRISGIHFDESGKVDYYYSKGDKNKNTDRWNDDISDAHGSPIYPKDITAKSFYIIPTGEYMIMFTQHKMLGIIAAIIFVLLVFISITLIQQLVIYIYYFIRELVRLTRIRIENREYDKSNSLKELKRERKALESQINSRTRG